jgi:hypothetical protein
MVRFIMSHSISRCSIGTVSKIFSIPNITKSRAQDIHSMMIRSLKSRVQDRLFDTRGSSVIVRVVQSLIDIPQIALYFPVKAKSCKGITKIVGRGSWIEDHRAMQPVVRHPTSQLTRVLLPRSTSIMIGVERRTRYTKHSDRDTVLYENV